MKAVLCLSTLWALLFTQSRADITVNELPNLLYIGHNYTLEWSAPEAYTYNLWLYLQTPTEGALRPAQKQQLGSDITTSSPYFNASYTWTVPSNISTDGAYSVWISGIAYTSEPGIYSGFVDSTNTNYFNVADAPDSPSTTGTSTSVSTITSPAATSHASSASNTSTDNTHHKSVSAGAIAGIVIGVLALIALIIGAVVFMGWRRKRTARQRRDAAARASRLAPVMQKDGNFEMQTPTSKAFDA